MNILDIINDYVDISVKWQRLNSSKHDEELSRASALSGANDTRGVSSLKIKKTLLESADEHSAKIQDIKAELAHIEMLLEHTHAIYNKAVEEMTYDALMQVFHTLLERVNIIKRNIAELEKKRNWATKEADLAFRNHNYQEEKYYSDIAVECFLSIQKESESIIFYQNFIKDLEAKAKEKYYFSSGNTSGVSSKK